jgi:hypothetical protein
MLLPPLFTNPGEALDFLTSAKPELLNADADANGVLSGRSDVFNHFGPIFIEGGDALSEDVFKDFLIFEKSSGWTGLYRQQRSILGNFENAKKAIRLLMAKPEYNDNIADRFDQAEKIAKGFGSGVVTPILFTAYPDYYGVWNTKSEFALNRLGLGIVEDKGESHGRKYEKINSAILHAKNSLNKNLKAGDIAIDLWSIDYIWHAVKVMSDDGRIDEMVTRFRAQ